VNRFKELVYEVHFSVAVPADSDETKVYQILQQILTSAINCNAINETQVAVTRPILVQACKPQDKGVSE
jgi:hypothetical protein